RFNWKTSLTHREVGRNLDYFAPGHFGVPPGKPVSIVFMIERSTLKELSAEFVILEYLKDESAHHQFHKYIALRETLWNSTMEKLGLDYRFKCVVNYPGILDTVKCVMASSSPPTREWWNDHCYFINGRILPDALEDL